MKKVKGFISILMAILVAVTMTMPVFADTTSDLLGVKIGVKVTLSGSQPTTAETFTFYLKAVDLASPLPEGAANGAYRFTITGANSCTIPAMTYSSVGIYDYTLYQKQGSNKNCSYDSTIYNLRVAITNGQDGKLKETVILKAGNGGEKQDLAEFKNTYKTVNPAKTTSITKTPASTNSTSSKRTAGNAKTGDRSGLLMYAGVFAGAGFLICIMLFMVLKKGRAKES